MALQNTGQISLKDVADEFSDSAPHSMSEFFGEGNAPASGETQLADFYGASSGPPSGYVLGNVVMTVQGDYNGGRNFNGRCNQFNVNFSSNSTYYSSFMNEHNTHGVNVSPNKQEGTFRYIKFVAAQGNQMVLPFNQSGGQQYFMSQNNLGPDIINVRMGNNNSYLSANAGNLTVGTYTAGWNASTTGNLGSGENAGHNYYQYSKAIRENAGTFAYTGNPDVVGVEVIEIKVWNSIRIEVAMTMRHNTTNIPSNNENRNSMLRVGGHIAIGGYNASFTNNNVTYTVPFVWGG